MMFKRVSTRNQGCHDGLVRTAIVDNKLQTLSPHQALTLIGTGAEIKVSHCSEVRDWLSKMSEDGEDGLSDEEAIVLAIL